MTDSPQILKYQPETGGRCSMFELSGLVPMSDLRRIEQGTWDWSPLHVQQHALWRPWLQLISSRRAWMMGQLGDGWVRLRCSRKARLELEVPRHVSDCFYVVRWRAFLCFFWLVGRFLGNCGFTCKTRSKGDGGTPKTRYCSSWDDVCFGASSKIGNRDASSLKGSKSWKNEIKNKDLKTRWGSSVHLSSFDFILSK